MMTEENHFAWDVLFSLGFDCYSLLARVSQIDAYHIINASIWICFYSFIIITFFLWKENHVSHWQHCCCSFIVFISNQFHCWIATTLSSCHRVIIVESIQRRLNKTINVTIIIRQSYFIIQFELIIVWLPQASRQPKNFCNVTANAAKLWKKKSKQIKQWIEV